MELQRGTRNEERGTLVIQTAYLGDVVLTLALIQRLAERHGPVDVLVTPESVPLLAEHPAVRQAIPYDKRGADRGLAGFHRILGILRGRGYQRALLPHRSLRSALLARSIPVPERIGFQGGLAGHFHTSTVARPDSAHETERLLALLPGATMPTFPFHPINSAAFTVAIWIACIGVSPRYFTRSANCRALSPCGYTPASVPKANFTPAL